MTQPAEQRPAIAAAVVIKDGRVLMVRRRVAEGELSWQFPAGEVEVGESSEAAAVRETAEETGVTVRPIQHLGERIHPATQRAMVYIACEPLAGAAHVADPDDVAEVEWCDKATLAEYVSYPFYETVQLYLGSALA
jgi:8-oxo-dGTP diphosphatase